MPCATSACAPSHARVGGVTPDGERDPTPAGRSDWTRSSLAARADGDNAGFHRTYPGENTSRAPWRRMNTNRTGRQRSPSRRRRPAPQEAPSRLRITSTMRKQPDLRKLADAIVELAQSKLEDGTSTLDRAQASS